MLKSEKQSDSSPAGVLVPLQRKKQGHEGLHGTCVQNLLTHCQSHHNRQKGPEHEQVDFEKSDHYSSYSTLPFQYFYSKITNRVLSSHM